MNEMCCEAFKSFIPVFKWFKTESNVFLMPHIECGKQKMRINHCPSCGKEVRSIELTEEEMKKLLSL